MFGALVGCRHTDGQDLGGDSTPGPGSSSGVRGFLQVCVCVSYFHPPHGDGLLW